MKNRINAYRFGGGVSRNNRGRARLEYDVESPVYWNPKLLNGQKRLTEFEK